MKKKTSNFLTKGEHLSILTTKQILKVWSTLLFYGKAHLKVTHLLHIFRQEAFISYLAPMLENKLKLNVLTKLYYYFTMAFQCNLLS